MIDEQRIWKYLEGSARASDTCLEEVSKYTIRTAISRIQFRRLSVLQTLVGPWLLQFRNNFYTDGRTPWTSDQPIARPVPIHRTKQTQNKLMQTSMSSLEFEPTILAFEWAKIVHVSDRLATVIGPESYRVSEFSLTNVFCHVENDLKTWDCIELFFLHSCYIRTENISISWTTVHCCRPTHASYTDSDNIAQTSSISRACE
jgi:hypothetical protein